MPSTSLEVFSAITQLGTVAGIFLLYRQIEMTRKGAESQLINELEKEFAGYYLVFAKIKPNGVWHTSVELNPEEIAQLENLAAFCEKLKHFHDRGILDWATLDVMFRNRFFLIMHNTNVLKLVIEPCKRDWEVALKLESDWIERLPQSDSRRNTRQQLVQLITAP